MSNAVIFGVGGILFIATTWATIAFMLARVIRFEDRETVEDRHEVDRLPPPSQT